MFRRCCLALAEAKIVESTFVGTEGKSKSTIYSPEELTPKKVVSILDAFIVGQTSAKRAVAVALRNRWRRTQVADAEMRDDILPKNILMIGPTGVGKTEIARRLAKITDAPFIKVEATKYTEVGFKGKDVDSIVEDLYTAAKTRARRRLERDREEEAEKMAHDMIFSSLTRQQQFSEMSFEDYMKKYSAGELNDAIVTVQVTVQPIGGGFGSQGRGPMEIIIGMAGGRTPPQKQNVTKVLTEVFPLAKKEALMKLIDDDQTNALAKTIAEEEGIVFIDEIDKVICEAGSVNADVSSLGVQQDLLPIVEGSIVTMKDGTQISTSNVLFFCCGAFHNVKPSDMIAELQGRLPVRVELKSLTEQEFRKILLEPKFNLLLQQQELLKTEKVELVFAPEAVNAIASFTAQVNHSAQNIGARRLNTILERVMDEFSFNCDKYEGKKVVVDAAIVKKATKPLVQNIDLAKYLL